MWGHGLVGLIAGLLLLAAAGPTAAQTAAPPDVLAPLAGAIEPRVQATLGDDGIHRQAWAALSFLDLRDDHREALRDGRRLAVIFEQRGCIYCTKMHTEVLSQRWINDYVRSHFRIVQIDLWGSREVTDFDGRKMAEKALAERWGVMFTPTIVFLKEDIGADATQWGPPLEVTRMSLGIGAATFIDMFVWIRTRTNERDRNFQRFHLARMAEREKAGTGE